MPRVLLVDDSPLVLRALPRLLGAYAQVECAQGHAEAIWLLERQRFEVLIADKEMPGLDALALLEEAQRLRPKTLRVLVSLFPVVPLPPVVERVLRKPVELDDLLGVLRG